MGKKRAQKDRGYITSKEHREEWGGYKDKKKAPFQRLPFNCCAITFTPFEDPVCTEDGTVYDIVHVVPYVKKYGKHPVTGAPLELGDLIKLNIHKNAGGQQQQQQPQRKNAAFIHPNVSEALHAQLQQQPPLVQHAIKCRNVSSQAKPVRACPLCACATTTVRSDSTRHDHKGSSTGMQPLAAVVIQQLSDQEQRLLVHKLLAGRLH